jgi:hypothetical protein
MKINSTLWHLDVLVKWCEKAKSGKYTRFKRKMNFKGDERKQVWPRSIIPALGQINLRKPKTSVRIVSLQAEIWTWNLLSMKQECNRIGCKVQSLKETSVSYWWHCIMFIFLYRQILSIMYDTAYLHTKNLQNEKQIREYQLSCFILTLWSLLAQAV